MAAFGKFRVISALVATVVPWLNRSVCPRSTPACSTPAMTPSMGSAVDGTLATSRLPLSGSSTHTSVKVPPTSTATTERVWVAMQECCPGLARLHLPGRPT